MSDDIEEQKPNDVEQQGLNPTEDKQQPEQQKESIFDKIGDVIMAIIRFLYK